MRRGSVLLLACLLGLAISPARTSAGEDPLDTAKSLVELGKMLVETGSDMGDDHKEYFAGENALLAGGKDNTMNQFG